MQVEKVMQQIFNQMLPVLECMEIRMKNIGRRCCF